MEVQDSKNVISVDVNSVIDHIKTHKAELAKEYLTRDRQLVDQLFKLYKNPSDTRVVNLFIAGKEVSFAAFHHNEHNIVTNKDPTTRKEYVTTEDNSFKVPRLYCWILKAAITTMLSDIYVDEESFINNSEISVKVNGNNRYYRIFFEMCVIENFAQDKKYVLLAIMTTMCNKPRTDLLLKNELSDEIIIWNEFTELKFCYSLPDVTIDYDHCHNLRMKYFRDRSYFYDIKRKIPIDSHMSLRSDDLSNPDEVEKLQEKNSKATVVIIAFRFLI
jgi:hypothetical protein